MLFHAAWQIHTLPSGLSDSAGRRQIEQALHRLCGPRMAGQPGYDRAGRDWCLASAADAEREITNYMGAEPVLRDAHKARKVTNDKFRNPRPGKVAINKYKVVAWVYRERFTGRLKTQFCDDWTSPHEFQRRYSHNGIDELAAFSYEGAVGGKGNLSVLEAWRGAAMEFGFGIDDTFYGWLREDADLKDVLAFFRERLSPCRIGKGTTPPSGVKHTYNQA
jgi:hypothetical protein